MKPQKQPLLERPRVLRTNDLQEGQAFTSRVWAKHESHVVGDGGYESTISRVPLGRSFLSFVDCPSPMHVEAEGNKTKATIYLPLDGSLTISAGGMQLSAVPGGPAFIPEKTSIRFDATPIYCILMEVSAAKLRSQLAAYGVSNLRIPPLDWDPSTPDACSLTEILGFATREIDRGISSEFHLLRLESLLLSALARAIASRLAAPAISGKKSVHETLAHIQAWIAKNLRREYPCDSHPDKRRDDEYHEPRRSHQQRADCPTGVAGDGAPRVHR